MKRNAIKIVCNPFMNEVSYFFKNELGEWLLLSGSSPLSRQYYTKANIKDRSKEIIEKIDEIYNRKNRGLDIHFQGTTDSCEYISGAIKTYLSGRNVSCQMESTKIAVVGKKKVGKTTLINGIAGTQGYKFEVISKGQYVQYEDKHNHVDWIEVNGIDFGTEKVEEAFGTISELVNEGLSKVVYCISGDYGLIEETEKSMIIKLKETFPSIDVITTVTLCYKDEVQTVIDEIEKTIGHGEVFPILAQEYKSSTRMRGMVNPFIVEPFGLIELATFIFEGKRLSPKLSTKIKDSTRYEKASESVEKPNQKKTDISNSESVKKDNYPNDASIRMVKDDSKPQDEKNAPMVSGHKTEGIKIENPEKVTSKSNFQKIVVVGKKSVGKSTLIKGCGKEANHILTITSHDGYQIYEDKADSLQWCEVKGIDIGKGKMEEAYSTVVKLAADGMTHLIYCISMETGKVEESEIELIADIKKKFPDLKIIIVLTKCYKDETPALLKLLRELKPVAESSDIIQTLAKEYKTGIKDQSTGEALVISAFNLGLVYGRVRGENI